MYENVKSNFRFSLSLRIALRYGMFHLSSLLWVFVVFTVVFMVSISPGYIEKGKAIAANYASDGFVNSYPDLKVQIVASDGNVLYSDGGRIPAFMHVEDGKILVRVRYTDENETQFNFVADVRGYLWQYSVLLSAIFAFELLRIISMIASRKKLAKSVLKPIDEMTAAAETLTGSNMEMRLNIYGTKNELRDLASVINKMLDGIELSQESQKAFVSDASHELRTPISVIQGYARILERWGMTDPEVSAEAIEAITSETESMRDLIEKLLFLARHDKKTFKLEKELFDLGDLCAELVRDTELITGRHTVLQGEKAAVLVSADKGAVKQTLRVFIDNAIKYTPDGGTITISCEDGGDMASISVADSGPGMTREEAVRAFDRFFRADSARASKTSGHGLGLSIARLIAQSHGGKIAVKTAPGEGATFRLLLPK